MKISKKIWMRVVFLVLTIGIMAIAFAGEWHMADLFHVTWNGRTYLETQTYLISRITPIGYASIMTAVALIGMEAYYRLWTSVEKEVTNE